MPDISWNASAWSDPANWRESGEEWSLPWGNSEAQWFGSLYPRLRSFLPTGTILEIAPGFGRWTRFLLAMSDRYYGVDLSNRCVEECRDRFHKEGVEFHLTDGKSLAMIPDRSIDFVFTFDSLVHAELDVLESYIIQIMQKLTDRGTAFIHHSNLAALGNSQSVTHGRAASVSAVSIANIVSAAGGQLLRQEIIDWRGVQNIDVLTLFASPRNVNIHRKTTINNEFMKEAEYVKQVLAPWSFNDDWTERHGAARSFYVKLRKKIDRARR